MKYCCLQRDCQSVALSSAGGPPLQTPAVEAHIVPIHQVLLCILVAWKSDCNKNMNCCSLNKTIFSDVLNVNRSLKTVTDHRD